MIEKYPWRTGRSCVFKVYNHLVFVTKYRRGVFTSNILNTLKLIFAETCKQMESELLEFGGEDDHVHLMVSSPPKLAIANLVGKLKGKSSYILRKEFWPHIKQKLWGNNLWSPSYCVVSCGGSPLDMVKKYIEEQRTPTSERSAKISKRERGHRYHTKNVKPS